MKLKIIATIPGCSNVEDTIRKNLKAFRFRGEWFEPADEVLEYIEKIQRVDPKTIVSQQLKIFQNDFDCPYCGKQHGHEGENDHYSLFTGYPQEELRL